MQSAVISMSGVLASLSRALDLTEGQPCGHTVRSCLIGMRLGRDVGLSSDEMSALHYALLLKDAGCSSNAGPTAELWAIPSAAGERRSPRSRGSSASLRPSKSS